MARYKLTWQWGNRDGEIIIRKSRGKLTMEDIFTFLHEKEQLNVFDGCIAVTMFRVSGDRQPDMWEEEDEGDEQLVFIVGDDNICPICGKNELFTQYCPNCGERLWTERSHR